MMRRLLVIVSIVAAVLAAGDAGAKSKAKPKTSAGPVKVTENDIRICMGVDGSTPPQQVEACSKILATGKIKHPYEGDYYATRAAAFFAMNLLDQALADLNKALAVRKAPEFYFQRALVYLARQEAESSKQDLAEVMKLKPEFAPTYLLRGVISYNEARYEEAVGYFDSAVKRTPTYYQALFARGVAKKKTGEESSGNKDIADARGMSPKVDDDLKKFGLTP